MSVSPGQWVEQWLSQPRFATYLTAAGNDRARALELYEWNTAMASAILHDLAHLEVAIRNAYDAALTAQYSGSETHWTRDPHAYSPVRMRTVRRRRHDQNEKTREQLSYAVREAGLNAPDGKVIAELMFGFWRYLTISARETNLWLPCLRHAFVPGTSRPAIDDPMGRLHMLRNRVAHHEPLLRQNLAARRNDVTALLGRISPDLRDYAASVSTWATVEARRP